MMGRTICFERAIWKIIPKLSLLPFLSELQTRVGIKNNSKIIFLISQ